MQNLTKIKRSAGDEIQLTDAIAQEIDQGRDVYGYQFSGQRFDCGSKAGFLQATVAFGLERDDLHDEFSEFLTDLKISQSQIIQGFCKFAPPHMIVRAETLEEDLKLLTQQVGLTWYAPPSAPPPQGPALAEIYDAELETLAREAYAADYTNFGFKPLEI